MNSANSIKFILLKFILILFICFSFSSKTQAACAFTIEDKNGVFSSNPYWVQCEVTTDFLITIRSDIALANCNIDFGDGTVLNNVPINPASYPHTYTFAIDTFIVRVTDNISGCVVTGVVVMEKTPSASIQVPLGSPNFLCAPASFDFINSSTNISPSTTFSWDFGDGTPVLYFDSTNHNQTVSHTYLPYGASCLLTISLTAQNYCGLTNNTYGPIKVWDKDSADITPDRTIICYPNTTFTFNNTTNKNCTAPGPPPEGNTTQRYAKWHFGDYWGFGTDSIIGWIPALPPADNHTISYPGIGTYNVMLIDSSYCGLDTAYMTVQVISQPTAVVSILPSTTICAGFNLTIVNGSVGGNFYRVKNGDAGSSYVAIGAPPTGRHIHQYNTPGTYTVSLFTYIDNPPLLGCRDTTYIPITVLTAPVPDFSMTPSAFCDTATVSFTDLSTGADQWTWLFDNGNTATGPTPPSQFYSGAPDTYTVTLNLLYTPSGCVNSIQKTINAYQSPNVTFTAGSFCADNAGQFTDNSTVAMGDSITTRFWNFDDLSTLGGNDSLPTHVYSLPGIYTVSLTVTNDHSCSSSDTLRVTVEALPTVVLTALPTAGCTPLSVNFSDASLNASTYQWDFGDGSAIDNNPNTAHTFINTSLVADITYTVSHIAISTFGCRQTGYQTIRVNHGPKADYTRNGTTGCSPINILFTDASIGAATYLWDFSDGTTTSSVNPSHIFSNTSTSIQNFTISLSVQSSSGCINNKSEIFSVWPKTDYTITATPGDSGCHPLNVLFSTLPFGGVNYDWTFGDGTTLSGGFPTPSHIYNNTNTLGIDSIYPLQLIVRNGFFCYDTVIHTIKVHPLPVPNYLADVPFGCPPLNVNFSNTSIGGAKYEWDFNDNSAIDTLFNATHVFTNTVAIALNRDVKLTATSSKDCISSITKPINVFPYIDAQFSSDTSGCSPHTQLLNNLSIADPSVAFTWFYGDGGGSNSYSPLHTFINSSVNDTVFSIKLVATSANYGCTDSIRKNIRIYPSPAASFIALPLSQTYPNSTVTLTNTTNNGIFKYLWDYGDNTNSTVKDPAPHTYATWGTYSIKLWVSNLYCTDSATQNVIIIPPPPKAGFTLTPDSGCAPFLVSFTDTSLYTNPTLNKWDFGDGTITNEINASHTYPYPGTYVVTLFVTGEGGQADVSQLVVVYPEPFSAFVYTPFDGKIYVPADPLLLLNLSSSEDGETYLWKFGDGNTSTEQNPTYYYTEEGTYDITLVVTNQYGCMDSTIKQSAVIAEAAGDINLPNAFTPSDDGPNGGEFDPNGLDNNVFFAFTKGVSEYNLRIYNRWGELLFESTDINKGWDGYYKGNKCPRGVYIIDVIAKTIDGKTIHKSGDVTLLR